MSVFNEMVDLIKSAWIGREFLVPCLVGPAGIGKTAAVKQAAKELGAGKMVTIIASQILPNEVSGITMPVAETKAMEIYDHYRLSSLKDGDILFFDELLEADELVLSACLTLIESRELMSGRKLPDIMIVAATNPTIKPNNLKENIRQRFQWKDFPVDRPGCREYIKKEYGLDVGNILVNKLVETGDEYNILSQRSLTKMAAWMSLAKDRDEAEKIASWMDRIWKFNIGQELLKAWLTRNNSPELQMRRAIRIALEEHDVTREDLNDIEPGMEAIMYDDKVFEQTSITELVEILSKLPEWDSIVEDLSNKQLEEPEIDETVSF